MIGGKALDSLMCAEELVYREIKQRIIDGRLAPGTRLVHRQVAKELGVSPNPVVLALRTLERDGLVVNTPGLGACVRTWTREKIIDLYQIRAVQEGLAARLCAERATPADKADVMAALDDLKASNDANDPEADIDADMRFHAAIMRGAHCPELQTLVENAAIMECSMRAFGMSLGIPRLLSQDVKGVHDSIAQAIAAGDPTEAEAAARWHVEDSLKRNLAWIEQVVRASTTQPAPSAHTLPE